jgi:putative tricarboxylic transport membrane protein
MRARVKNPKDFFAGLLFLAIAGVFAYKLNELPIGTAFRMGPGYFPMLLCILLAAFGAIILVSGIRVDGPAIGEVPWRGVALILLPIMFFGFTLKGLGLIPALAITVFATTLASRRFRLRAALLNTAVLVVASWLIFIKGLGLPISILGPWLGGY